MIAERIKELREKNEYTQASLAKRLNVTRSAVNAWEMGISVPSTALIIQLSKLFQVSADYMLGIQNKATLDVSNLSEKEIMIVYDLVQYFKTQKENK